MGTGTNTATSIDFEQAVRAIQRGGYILSPGANAVPKNIETDGSWVATISIYKGSNHLGRIDVDSAGPAKQIHGKDSPGRPSDETGTLDGVPNILLTTIKSILEQDRSAYSPDMYKLFAAQKK